jgi:hypothetical protein
VGLLRVRLRETAGVFLPLAALPLEAGVGEAGGRFAGGAVGEVDTAETAIMGEDEGGLARPKGTAATIPPTATSAVRGVEDDLAAAEAGLGADLLRRPDGRLPRDRGLPAGAFECNLRA